MKTFTNDGTGKHTATERLKNGWIIPAQFVCCQLVASFLFISLITRMRYKRDIKMGRLCTPGGAVIGIVGGGVTFRFF